MAFNLENNTSSLRLNLVPVGTLVDVIDYDRKKVMATGIFGGFYDRNQHRIPSPEIMRHVAQDVTIRITVVGKSAGDTEVLILVKDPDGYGAFGRMVDGKWCRVTVYANTSLTNAVHAAKIKERQEKYALELTPKHTDPKPATH